MSRTYRTHLDWQYRAQGRNWTWEEMRDYHNVFFPDFGWNGKYFLNRKSRDRKVWDKPPKWFKVMKRRNERAKVKSALYCDRDIPVFPHSDQWDWT